MCRRSAVGGSLNFTVRVSDDSGAVARVVVLYAGGGRDLLVAGRATLERRRRHRHRQHPPARPGGPVLRPGGGRRGQRCARARRRRPVRGRSGQPDRAGAGAGRQPFTLILLPAGFSGYAFDCGTGSYVPATGNTRGLHPER